MTLEKCPINFCKNNGDCYINGTNNNKSWWCACPPCTTGLKCEINNNILWTNPPTVMKIMIGESSFNYRALFLFCVCFMVLIGLINSFLSLSTYLNSKTIRESYRGIYLISYAICSTYVMIFIGIRYGLALHASKLITQSYLYQYIFDCYIGVTMNAIIIAVSMWCSSLLAIERTLLELFFFKFFGMTRKRVLIIFSFIVIFCTCGRIPTILMKMIVVDPNEIGLYKCGNRVNIKQLSDIEVVFVWINAGGTCFLHFLAHILTIISIIRRKLYLSSSSSKVTDWNIYRTQISQHIDCFIPPTVILLCQLAPMLFFEVGRSHACIEPKLSIWSHFHLVATFLNYVPQSVTFFIFVLPSKSFMKEFYSHTIVGKCIFKLTHINSSHHIKSTHL